MKLDGLARVMVNTIVSQEKIDDGTVDRLFELTDDMGVYIEKPGAKREWAMVIAGLTDDEQVAELTLSP